MNPHTIGLLRVACYSKTTVWRTKICAIIATVVFENEADTLQVRSNGYGMIGAARPGLLKANVLG